MEVKSNEDSAGEFCCVGCIFSMKLLRFVSKAIKLLLTLRLPRVLVPTSDTNGVRADPPPPHVSHDRLTKKREIFVRNSFTANCLMKGKVDQIPFALSPW